MKTATITLHSAHNNGSIFSTVICFVEKDNIYGI